jgi:signal transduction histidine kinase
VTSLVALAFLIPLALVVGQLARERAVAEAERYSSVVVAVLTVTTDPTTVQRAISTNTGADAVDRVAVHGLAGAAPWVGHSRARVDDIRLASDQPGPIIVEVPGGLAYLKPVDVGRFTNAVVEVYIPGERLSSGVSGAWWALLAIGLGLVVVAVLIGDRLAKKVVAPAAGLARAATALGGGDLKVRVTPSGPRELAEAGAAFNAMADRVAGLLTTERELIADLSHRLRTPLTIVRLETETLGDPRVRQAIDDLEREVDDLIRAARVPAVSQTPAEQGCDAGEVVRNRMGFWSAVAEDQGRTCAVYGADAPAPVQVSRSDLGAAFDAVLGNVFRYTPQGTPFEVIVSRRRGWVSVRVEDGGAGIPDPERALQRGASDQGSTGLGLDIAKRATQAGGGALSIDRGHLGGASVVMLFIDAENPPETPRMGWLLRRR